MGGLPPGTRLGPYEIVGLVGAGGMGDVYKARDTRLDRLVALKISRDEFTPRFESEARATAALEHPHICRLYDVCHEGGTSFLVMEYVEGTPIKGPVPLEQALTYARQIASALDEAHRKLFQTHISQGGTLGFRMLRYDVTRDGKRFLINSDCDGAEAPSALITVGSTGRHSWRSERSMSILISS